MTISPSEPVTIRPQAVSPSWGWALRRAALGLVLMVAMTTVAAYLANASIELSADPAPASISIGTPAAALLKK
ncbi:MAG: hypothetical protein ABL901_19820 [Hyphomicrobiaceae bacterium]